MGYEEFLASKAWAVPTVSVDPAVAINPALFGFQHDVVRWALRKGRAAIFADCGMGKTLMQLEWAKHVVDTMGDVLILAPLAVAQQTVAEGARFGIEARYVRREEDRKPGITITNYEMLDHFDADAFAGVVLDESSILKSFDGSTRNEIIQAFRETPVRLACTATPAPNDFMELGNHAEFLGIMTMAEMLASFFVHDGGETQKWRLKGHARDEFWRWICSWAVTLRRPSDLGYPNDGFDLPTLGVHRHIIQSSQEAAQAAGMLFAVPAVDLIEQRAARRATLSDRVAQAASLVAAEPSEPWILWCDLNDESDALAKAIPGAMQVRGSDDREDKERALMAFASGKLRVLITKPSIAGFGMNWQHCARVCFVGLSHSYEQFYQAVRRCWRFGQDRPVDVHVIISDLETRVAENIERKEADAQALAEGMAGGVKDIQIDAVRGTSRETDAYDRDVAEGEGWTVHLGDCVDVTREMAPDSIDFTVFSPPFASLYTYSASDRDMGNCRDHAEFHQHFGFLIDELTRITKPGRLCSFHCMNIPTSKARDGVIGITDFRGILIRAFVDRGWIFHSEVCIWKDPVTAMQRTKAIGLLYKQLRKDSTISRQGIADYLVTMRKPGDNAEPVTKTHEGFPVALWQRYASPVWMDIEPNDTLNYRAAREHEDERHICPLQLEVIRRAIRLWTNPDDIVLSPFAGVGSEGFVAREMGRRFIGVELKRSYWKAACANLARAHATNGELFDSSCPEPADD